MRENNIALWSEIIKNNVPPQDIAHSYNDLFLKETELTRSFVEPFRNGNPGNIADAQYFEGYGNWYIIYDAYQPYYDKIRICDINVPYRMERKGYYNNIKSRKLTHNEYEDFCKECVSKIGNHYSIEDYHKDTTEIEIVPFYELYKFPQLCPSSRAWINTLFTHEKRDDKGNYMLTSHTLDVDGYWSECRHLGIDYHAMDGYGGYGFSDIEWLIYTFTEGDTTLLIFKDEETYLRKKASTIEWYANHY